MREKALHCYTSIVKNSANAAELAKCLDVSVEIIHQKARERFIYAFDVNGEPHFPLVQFENSREMLGLTEALKQLPAGLTPIEFATWFITTSNELGSPDGET